MKKRIISAIIMLMIAIPLIILGKKAFILGIAVIGLMSFYEIIKLNKYPKIVKILSFISYMIIIFNNYESNFLINNFDFKLLALAILLTLIPVIKYQPSNEYTTSDAFSLTSFLLLVGLGLNFLLSTRNYSLSYFILLMLIPIFTDTFAYFGGMLIGKHKVTKLSPKKNMGRMYYWAFSINHSFFNILYIFYRKYSNFKQSFNFNTCKYNSSNRRFIL